MTSFNSLGAYLANNATEVENALQKVNNFKEEFTSIQSLLIAKGIGETEFGQIFSGLSKEFGELYATAKSRYDELVHDQNELNVGFKDW